LRRRLEGLFERRQEGWAITLVVGHLQLPSGELLRIRSPKASAASVLAWPAYVDPTLGPLQELRALPASADEGDIGALLARLFVDELTRVAHGHGLTRRYQRQAVRSASIRGRIDFARLSHAGGDLSRTPCIAWERRQQTPLNQTLAAAVDRVPARPHTSIN
jgi:5-methylcytosine-specific restriction endonuclease McrBC regulatory subunit McrC